MSANKTIQGTNSILMACILLAVLVIINLISQNRFFRIDLTEHKEYTLSDSTKKILREMDDVVNVKLYFTRELPTYLVTMRQQVKDLLDEYQTYGGENLLLEWEDPADDPEMEQRVRILGIPQVQLQIIEKDKAQAVNAYLGIAILYEDRSEVIPVVQNVANLEYDLTSAILKVSRTEEKTVGFLEGPVGVTLENGLTAAARALERQYSVVPVDLSGGDPVPPEVQTLVVVQPQDVSDRVCFEIDQFVMRGGALLLFHDPIDLVEGSIQAKSRRSGLEEMLSRYGIDVGKNLVLDARSNSNASFTQGFLTFSMPYPYWVKILTENMDLNNPMVNQLGGIVLPWTSTVAAAADAPESVQIDTLLRTTNLAWTKTGEYDLNPQQRFPDTPREPVDPYPVAVVASGVFPSSFADVGVPPVDDAMAEPDIPSAGEREIVRESRPTRVVVVGSGNVVADDMVGQFSANMLFYQNAVDWLTLGEDLISIRSRGRAERPLGEISERSKGLVRFLVTFGVPILVILSGLVRWIRRRKIQTVVLSRSEV